MKGSCRRRGQRNDHTHHSPCRHVGDEGCYRNPNRTCLGCYRLDGIRCQCPRSTPRTRWDTRESRQRASHQTTYSLSSLSTGGEVTGTLGFTWPSDKRSVLSFCTDTVSLVHGPVTRVGGRPSLTERGDSWDTDPPLDVDVLVS